MRMFWSQAQILNILGNYLLAKPSGIPALLHVNNPADYKAGQTVEIEPSSVKEISFGVTWKDSAGAPPMALHTAGRFRRLGGPEIAGNKLVSIEGVVSEETMNGDSFAQSGLGDILLLDSYYERQIGTMKIGDTIIFAQLLMAAGGQIASDSYSNITQMQRWRSGKQAVADTPHDDGWDDMFEPREERTGQSPMPHPTTASPPPRSTGVPADAYRANARGNARELWRRVKEYDDAERTKAVIRGKGNQGDWKAVTENGERVILTDSSWREPRLNYGVPVLLGYVRTNRDKTMGFCRDYKIDEAGLAELPSGKASQPQQPPVQRGPDEKV